MYKNPLDSKTLWFNITLTACALWFPTAHRFLINEPEAFAVFFMFANILLRWVTHEILTFHVPPCLFGVLHSKSEVAKASLELAKRFRAELTALEKPQEQNNVANDPK